MPQRKRTSSGRRPLRDPRLRFDEKEHAYFVGDRQFVSATQFIKAFDPPFKPFDKEKEAEKYARKHGRTPEDVIAEWDAAADYGTKVHKLVEEYILGMRQIDELGDPRAEQAASALDVIKNVYRYPEAEPEVRIYSEEHGVAGTIDVVLLPDDGGAVLVDWKTNKRLVGVDFPTDEGYKNLPDYKFTTYTLQLSLYAYILETEYGIECRKLKLVHLQDDRHITYDVPYVRDIIRQMLEEAKEHGTIG